MKICIVLRDITERGGGERVCANLANALSFNHQVRIISFYRNALKPAYSIHPEIKIHYLSCFGEKRGCFLQTLWRKIFYRYFLTYRAGQIFSDDDIILANDRALAPIFKQKNKKYIRLWHLVFPRKKKSLDFFDALVVLSSKELNQWQKIHHNIRVIPNFLPNISPKTTQWNQKTILSVGRMDRGDPKGFLRLVDIFASIATKYPQWRLHIVGEGILQKQIQAKIYSYGLQDQILLKPYTQEIEEEYLQASFYVMSSYSEGFGMVLLESGALGLASVAFDICSGPGDILQEGKSGFLLEDGDLTGFAKKIEVLIQDEMKREEMGKAAKQSIQEHFSQQAIIKLWEDLFNSLMSR